MASLSKRKRR